MVEPRGVLIPPTFAMNAKDAGTLLDWFDVALNEGALDVEQHDWDLVARLRVWRDRHAETD